VTSASPAPRHAPPEVATLALAHALRTPLTAIAMGLGLLDGGALGPLGPAQHEVVRALVAEAARLTLLVDHALQTDRLGAYAGPVDLHPTELGGLVEGAAAPIVAQARERGVAVRFVLQPGITVVADAVKLAWVVASVLGNALRYSPPGGTIDVALAAAAGEAELRIADQGPGLSPDVRDRLFDRSFGTALFLAREIIEALGGSIGAGPAPGGGSVFTLLLPLSATVPGDSPTEEGLGDEQEG
jgi:signal transduction histidine kinase